MIYGIGHDVLEIERMSAMLDGPLGGKFLDRILTGKERDLAAGRGRKAAEFAAGRFAAKEAVVKAFGCGIGRIMGFGDIEILPDPFGKPLVHISASAWERLELAESGYTVHLTITHTRDMASAFAVVEARDPESGRV